MFQVVHWINWKSIFALTICLMGIHFLFLSDAHFISKSPLPLLANEIDSTILPDAIHHHVKLPHVGSPPLEPLLEVAELDKPHVDGGSDLGVIDDIDENENEEVESRVEEYVAICMAVKDQYLDLPEFFIHHYHHLGIRRFYIMDDGSKPPLSTFKDYGVPRKSLTFEFQDQAARAPGHSQQLALYNNCIQKWGALHTWMAFIDADEFFETTSKETLSQILRSLEKDQTIGALGVNWQMHSSGGLLARPKSARKSFTTCIWDDPGHDGENSNNTHVKSIVKTSKYERPKNPHLYVLKDGAQTVGEKGDIIDSEAFRRPITRDRIALHHYAGKSRAEYEEKMLRGNAMNDPKGELFWNSLEYGLPHVNCTSMAKWNP